MQNHIAQVRVTRISVRSEYRSLADLKDGSGANQVASFIELNGAANREPILIEVREEQTQCDMVGGVGVYLGECVASAHRSVCPYACGVVLSTSCPCTLFIMAISILCWEIYLHFPANPLDGAAGVWKPSQRPWGLEYDCSNDKLAVKPASLYFRL